MSPSSRNGYAWARAGCHLGGNSYPDRVRAKPNPFHHTDDCPFYSRSGSRLGQTKNPSRETNVAKERAKV